jgi:CRP-like cAMP-binding protein
MKSLKLFDGWTLLRCQKLLHAIDINKTQKNQHIIVEGGKADAFYLVFSGEFEITKHLCLIPKKQVDARRYFDKRDLDDFKSYYHTVVKTFSNMNNVNREIAIKFIGQGQIFGLEDSITRKDDLRYYSYSVV